MAKKTTGQEPAKKDSAAKKRKPPSEAPEEKRRRDQLRTQRLLNTPVDTPLTLDEEKFVEGFLRLGSASKAYLLIHKKESCTRASARAMACRLLKKPNVRAALLVKRQEFKEALSFNLAEHIRILHGMATATLDEMCAVLEDPTNRESYTGLGYKRFALEQATLTDKARNVKLTNRREALNDLARLLGLDQKQGNGDRTDFLAEISPATQRLSRTRGDSEGS